LFPLSEYARYGMDFRSSVGDELREKIGC